MNNSPWSAGQIRLWSRVMTDIHDPVNTKAWVPVYSIRTSADLPTDT